MHAKKKALESEAFRLSCEEAVGCLLLCKYIQKLVCLRCCASPFLSIAFIAIKIQPPPSTVYWEMLEGVEREKQRLRNQT